MIKGAIKMYATLVYALVFIATSAFAINHGVEGKEYFGVVMGVLNLVAGGYSVYKVVKSENPKQ